MNQFIHVRSKAQPAPSLSVFVAVVLPVQTSKVIAESTRAERKARLGRATNNRGALVFKILSQKPYI